jgi:hypothetical protein
MGNLTNGMSFLRLNHGFLILQGQITEQGQHDAEVDRNGFWHSIASYLQR